MMSGLRKCFVLALVVLAAYGVLPLASQQRPVGPYTAAQATAGQASYQANCANCHPPTLAGQGDVPPLSGSTFAENWGRRTTQDLVSFLQLTMPPTRAGSLTPEEYVNIVAYILQVNGVPAGNQALTAT